MANLTLTPSGETAAILPRLTAKGGCLSPEAALAALPAEQHNEDPALERWLRAVRPPAR